MRVPNVRLTVNLVWVLVLGACGSDADTGTATDTAQTTASDAAEVSTDSGEPPAEVTPDDTAVTPETAVTTDATTAETTPSDTTTTTPDSSDTVDASDTTPQGETSPGDYLAGCDSLFAARVVEKQVEADATFPSRCDVPLRNAIGRVRDGGPVLCIVGETANACRTRLYDTPPAMADRAQGCASQSPVPASCLRGKYLAKCADGTDTCPTPEAICQDGMRPMVYAEPATTGPSDVWYFFLGGEGAPCTGPMCWYNYRYARLNDKVEFELAMSTAHPDHSYAAAKLGSGVMNGAPVAGNPAADWNRVHFKRCTDAASRANETAFIGDGIPADWAEGLPDLPVATRTGTVPVFHRGFDTWRAAFRLFTTTSGRDLDGDGTPELPSLAAAKQVILAGASDASGWVVFAADRLADELRTIAGADVDVRIMIDGYFEPAFDNEGRYHADAPADFDMFGDPYAETGLCLLPDNGDGLANEACSDAAYIDGPWRRALDARQVVRDASCETYHAVGAPQCSDKLHTLLHHVATPVFILADQEDGTVSGGSPIYADTRGYHWADPATYRRRVLDAAKDIAAHWSTAAREEGAGTAGNFALAMPKSRREGEPWGHARHVRFHDDAEMKSTMDYCSKDGNQLASIAFATMMGAWMKGTVPTTFVWEDAAALSGTTSYWVTGGHCRTPE